MKYIVVVFLFMSLSCTQNNIKEKDKADVIIKPAYSVDLLLWLRRSGEGGQTWRNIKNNAQVHFARHDLTPMFRMYKVLITPKDTVYDYFLGKKTLNAFCKDTLVETNDMRNNRLEDYSYIHSGKEGLLKCVDKEELLIQIYYRKRNDTISNYQVDSLRYEIILDKVVDPHDF